MVVSDCSKTHIMSSPDRRKTWLLSGLLWRQGVGSPSGCLLIKRNCLSNVRAFALLGLGAVLESTLELT